jgi:hypothetical protein
MFNHHQTQPLTTNQQHLNLAYTLPFLSPFTPTIPTPNANHHYQPPTLAINPNHQQQPKSPISNLRGRHHPPASDNNTNHQQNINHQHWPSTATTSHQHQAQTTNHQHQPSTPTINTKH